MKIYDKWIVNKIRLELDWEFLVADKQLSFRVKTTNDWATTCSVNWWTELPVTNNWSALIWWELTWWEFVTFVVNSTADWFELYPEFISLS